jgi:hypothetical protein
LRKQLKTRWEYLEMGFLYGVGGTVGFCVTYFFVQPILDTIQKLFSVAMMLGGYGFGE